MTLGCGCCHSQLMKQEPVAEFRDEIGIFGAAGTSIESDKCLVDGEDKTSRAECSVSSPRSQCQCYEEVHSISSRVCCPWLYDRWAHCNTHFLKAVSLPIMLLLLVVLLCNHTATHLHLEEM